MVINHVTTLYKNGRQTTLAALAVILSVVWLSLLMMQHESDPGTLKHLLLQNLTWLRGTLPGLADKATHLGRSLHLLSKHDEIKMRDYNGQAGYLSYLGSHASM